MFYHKTQNLEVIASLQIIEKKEYTRYGKCNKYYVNEA